MDRKNFFSSRGSRIALLFFQLVVVLLCAGYIEYIYYADIYPERQVKKVFTPADCSIINSRLSQKGDSKIKYRADFLITYNVKGVQYNRWVSGNGLEMLYSDDRGLQEELLGKYTAGNTYTCWYNPLLPQVSVLVAKHNWHSLLPLLIPFVIGVIALLFFFKSLLQLPGVNEKPKARSRKSKK